MLESSIYVDYLGFIALFSLQLLLWTTNAWLKTYCRSSSFRDLGTTELSFLLNETYFFQKYSTLRHYSKYQGVKISLWWLVVLRLGLVGYLICVSSVSDMPIRPARSNFFVKHARIFFLTPPPKCFPSTLKFATSKKCCYFPSPPPEKRFFPFKVLPAPFKKNCHPKTNFATSPIFILLSP